MHCLCAKQFFWQTFCLCDQEYQRTDIQMLKHPSTHPYPAGSVGTDLFTQTPTPKEFQMKMMICFLFCRLYHLHQAGKGRTPRHPKPSQGLVLRWDGEKAKKELKWYGLYVLLLIAIVIHRINYVIFRYIYFWKSEIPFLSWINQRSAFTMTALIWFKLSALYSYIPIGK